MAVYLLCNTIGNVATSASITFGTLMSGYNAYDAISGPRNKTVRGAAGASHRYRYDCPSSDVTHVVVARMDLFKNTLDASSAVVEYGPSNTTDSTTAVGALTLVGPTGQDWVKTISRTSTAFAVTFNSSVSTREFEYGKVYFSNAFSFGAEPDIDPRLVVRRAERTQHVRPAGGFMPYAVEASFSLSFSRVTRAKVASFEALPLNAPFFVYDDAAAVIPHKLEHCIFAGWGWTRVASDMFNVNLSLLRLAHYS